MVRAFGLLPVQPGFDSKPGCGKFFSTALHFLRLHVLNLGLAGQGLLLTVFLVQGILANSEDPDEMSQNVAFHQGLHCLLTIKNKLQGLKYIIIWKFLPVTP